VIQIIIASVAKLVIKFLVIKLAYQIYLVTLTAIIVLQAQKGITKQIDRCEVCSVSNCGSCFNG
jgi:hypothetical protein